VQFVTLNNGLKTPLLGYEVFQIPDLVEAQRCVAGAIAAGYRLIDTAATYLNEEAVGKGVRESCVARDELFVTSELWVVDRGLGSHEIGDRQDPAAPRNGLPGPLSILVMPVVPVTSSLG
jgi:diketogulonate reductase-like aldo/keto reductase